MNRVVLTGVVLVAVTCATAPSLQGSGSSTGAGGAGGSKTSVTGSGGNVASSSGSSAHGGAGGAGGNLGQGGADGGGGSGGAACNPPNHLETDPDCCCSPGTSEQCAIAWNGCENCGCDASTPPEWTGIPPTGPTCSDCRACADFYSCFGWCASTTCGPLVLWMEQCGDGPDCVDQCRAEYPDEIDAFVAECEDLACPNKCGAGAGGAGGSGGIGGAGGNGGLGGAGGQDAGSFQDAG